MPTFLKRFDRDCWLMVSAAVAGWAMALHIMWMVSRRLCS